MSTTATKKPRVAKVDPLPVYPDIIIGQTYVRGTADNPSDPPLFHWFLFVQDPQLEDGTKIHAITTPNGWAYERERYTMMYDPSMVVATTIGKLESHSLDDLDGLLQSIPMAVVPDVDAGREPKFACRV